MRGGGDAVGTGPAGQARPGLGAQGAQERPKTGSPYGLRAPAASTGQGSIAEDPLRYNA